MNSLLTPPSRRAVSSLALTLTFGLLAGACAPRQDPFHPDQAPDVNYSLTKLKDAKHLGTIQVIDDEVLARMAGRFPGCAIAIVDGDEIAYMQGYGVADFHVKANPFDDDPFTKSTVGGIGSVSKTLTAMAVMKLAELGHVNLNAAASTYFPHPTPAGWNAMTLRQLLSHRSGLPRDPDSTLPGTLTPAQVDLSFGPKSSQHPRYGIFESIFTTKAVPVAAQIGKYSYSNMGYLVLGAVIDWVTQQPAFTDAQRGYERFVWSMLSNASDAALTPCLDHPWRSTDIPDLAQSYDAAWNPMDTPYSGWQSAPGGWSMTVGDLARVLLALKGNQVLSPASLASMRTDPGAPADPSGYGLGVFLTSMAGRTAYHHGGVIDGFRCQVVVWPNEDVAVAVIANADRNGVGAIAEEVGRLWMDEGPFVPQLDRNDVAFRSTATWQVSTRHFGGAEDLVQGLRRKYGERELEAFLGSMLRSQSSTAASLADLVTRDPNRVEDASRLFLDTLARDGRVGVYR